MSNQNQGTENAGKNTESGDLGKNDDENSLEEELKITTNNSLLFECHQPFFELQQVYVI